MAKSWRVEVFYPAPIFEELDDLLTVLAASYGGRWVASGVGLTDSWTMRDIEFHFIDGDQAQVFAAKSTCIVGVRAGRPVECDGNCHLKSA